MIDETDILYWINCISVPHDEWTDDTARIAIEMCSRIKKSPYNETSKHNVLTGGQEHDGKGDFKVT